MEREGAEPSGVTRGQNAVHVIPMDWSAADSVLATLVDRIEPSRPETQVLVLTADAEAASAAADRLVDVVGDRAISVLPVTGGPRAARLLRSNPSHIVVGSPATLVQLLQASALKPSSVRGVLFAWLDPILETPEAAPLETLLGELPKEGARVVLASEMSPAYEALIERYARRARRTEEAADESAAAINAEYVTTAATARSSTLRRLLDALDLPRAELYARTEDVRRDASRIVRALGYSGDAVRIVSAPSDGATDPVILLELPTTRAEMRMLASAGRRVYALVQPSQLRSLRSLLGGGTLSPVTLIDAAERARGKDEALRASLREVLASGDVRREILSLEPLLAEFDGIEIAAAALRLLEAHRPERPAAAPAAAAGPLTRLFLNLGEKDGVRAQEIVKLIATEAGIPGSQIGKIEVRDTHSIVEVAASVSELVVEKLASATVKGRKVQARIDKPREREERRPRSGPPRDRDGGPPRGGRPPRAGGGPGGPRRFDREGSTRPSRPRPRRDDA